MKQGTINNYPELKEQLAFYAEDEYREFSSGLILSERPMLGVRIPKVRSLVGLVPKEKIPEFLEMKPVAIEEVLARGFLIARLPYVEMMKWFDSQVQYIDDWCTCDTFCASLKTVKKHQTEMFETKIEALLNDTREFAVRVGLILLKCYYVEQDWLEVIFDRVEKLAGREEYYVKMGIAWLICECFIKFPEETASYLQVSKLSKWTYNKTISKICDSYRVDQETKSRLRKMRK
ncbi:DNA alkylation repair protein [Candidatus Saccharibacteria bacterium]|nr:DNA alkylation repair protein [Candidatus Saccharibacteria bacterium]